MFYTIYKVTNLLDGKYYIGKHQTSDINDGYMGSGKLLKRAINKHGICNFIKEILFTFSTEEEMNSKEKELVIVSEETYNLCEGGKGGFGYINKVKTKEQRIKSASAGATVANTLGANLKGSKIHFEKMSSDTEYRDKWFESLHKGQNAVPNTWMGRKHSEQTKLKMSLSKVNKYNGKNNPSFGKCWVTNGVQNKLILKELVSSLPEGWSKGRKINTMELA